MHERNSLPCSTDPNETELNILIVTVKQGKENMLTLFENEILPVRIRSSRMVGASDCQCRSRNSPWFDLWTN
jgi:hypothetical protein